MLDNTSYTKMLMHSKTLFVQMRNKRQAIGFGRPDKIFKEGHSLTWQSPNGQLVGGGSFSTLRWHKYYLKACFDIKYQKLFITVFCSFGKTVWNFEDMFLISCDLRLNGGL